MGLFEKNNKGRGAEPGSQAQAPSILAAGTVITGQVKLSEDLRVDGTVIGDICSEKTVIIGPGGEVHGNISAAFLDIYGYLDGNAGITGHTFLRKGGFLHGDLKTTELEIETGAHFEGQCFSPSDKEDSLCLHKGLSHACEKPGQPVF